MIYEIFGNSMTGLLENGDQVELIDTLDFKRNDYIIYHDGGMAPSIKRVLGLPGDNLYVLPLLGVNEKVSKDTQILILWQNEFEIHPISEPQFYCWNDWKGNLKIPDGKLFCIGTIPDSIDSRSRGYVDIETQVIGKAIKIETK